MSARGEIEIGAIAMYESHCRAVSNSIQLGSTEAAQTLQRWTGRPSWNDVGKAVRTVWRDKFTAVCQEAVGAYTKERW